LEASDLEGDKLKIFGLLGLLGVLGLKVFVLELVVLSFKNIFSLEIFGL
jgi:hypothetical protein